MTSENLHPEKLTDIQKLPASSREILLKFETQEDRLASLRRSL
jgi:hypothetical protein